MRSAVTHLPAERAGACALLACALLAGLATSGPATLRALSAWVPAPAPAGHTADVRPDTVATMGIRN